jgi:cell division septal protein FtsQ
VAGVTLARLLPSTIDVQVAERVPMAIARIAQQLYLVDAAGVIIDEYGPQYRDFDLPIVDGLVAAQTAGAPAIDPGRLQAAADLLAALAASPEIAARVSQADVSNARDVVVLLDDDPARLHVGDEAFVERLQQYLELAPALHEQLAAIDYVDLRFGDRVFARAQGRSATVRRTAGR